MDATGCKSVMGGWRVCLCGQGGREGNTRGLYVTARQQKVSSSFHITSIALKSDGRKRQARQVFCNVLNCNVVIMHWFVKDGNEKRKSWSETKREGERQRRKREGMGEWKLRDPAELNIILNLYIKKCVCVRVCVRVRVCVCVCVRACTHGCFSPTWADVYYASPSCVLCFYVKNNDSHRLLPIGPQHL